MNIKAILVLITCLFIVLDIMTGIAKALKLKKFSSTVLREGAFHKVAFIVFIVLGFLCDFGQRYINLGFAVPVTKAICTYIIITEISSIIENACKLNPKIVPSNIKSFFIKVEGDK